MHSDMRNGLIFGAIFGVVATINSEPNDMGARIATIGVSLMLAYGIVRFLRWRRRKP